MKWLPLPVGVFLLLASPVSAQVATYRTTTTPWNPDSLGNNRAVLAVARAAPAAVVTIPWRRRDTLAAERDLIVVSAASGRRVRVARDTIDRISARFAFEPVDGPGTYLVYFMRYAGSVRSNYPRIHYPGPSVPPDTAWIAALGLAPGGPGWATLPPARLVAIEAVNDRNRFDPMEVVASDSEVAGLRRAHPGPLLAFPEDREHPIRMTRDLPYRWIEAGPGGTIGGTAERGEFFVFQVGVYAAGAGLDSLSAGYSGLRGGGGRAIPATAFRCINLGGVDWEGKTFSTRVDVPEGRVQALWFGVQVPTGAKPGRYTGQVTVAARGVTPVVLPIQLTVLDRLIPDAGDDDPARLSRLRWLDSRLHQDDEVVRPYTPVRVAGRTLSILGRDLTLAATGLPAQIRSYFAPEMTHLRARPRPLLQAPIALVVADSTGRPLDWHGAGVHLARRGPGAVSWSTRSTAGGLVLDLRGTLESDGNVEYVARLRATRSLRLDDVRLELPLRAEAARYLMGLGYQGGPRPAPFEWRWYQGANQDAAWIGDVNAGLQFTLRDQHYVRPLNTNFYQLKPLVMPTSWYNGGRGGCRFTLEGPRYQVRCFSGPRTMTPADTLFYNFRLLLTPFHPIDPATQFRTRFYHAYAPLDTVAAAGANVINVHHATPINPWLNYPFLRPDTMRAYIDAAHRRGMRVKIYYTVRELSTRAPELWALRSLGHEIFAPGAGGGYSWLQEHVGGDYIAGWYVPELKDATLINSGVSRWHNYYIEGLDWLARKVGIDGLYIDDVAFDRTTMKRVRKALDRHRPHPLIDLHSANQFDPNDGWASSANLYLEHFPYLDRLWFGEYFDYDRPPSYWLVEISGIPFGLMGEMLQDGGNPWRGMLFGMTNRLPWAGDPRPLWREWDRFGIEHARMIGWWVPGRPVRTGRPDVLATSYVRRGRTLVALASWAPDTVRVALRIDWRRLGLDSTRTRLVATAIDGFQPAAEFAPSTPVAVAPGKGWLIELKSGP